ncbi:antitoxin protein of toxin-antitoxin system [Haloactinospora alba]|uniref:Antitoxin protein of toxin-antitoxin system n=1 Tax=Haloactinospora alba TaxID=405555 RepID=A0A543NKP9_9ACTN|nr:antitoxin [Haloactinospora alba]TQN32372.1 antitoxin protein of toxin-antitoxin system [Haloactinospora alba]
MARLFDKAKQAASENSNRIAEGVRKAAETAKQKTGGKYDDKIDKAKRTAEGYLPKQDDEGGDSQGSGGRS